MNCDNLITDNPSKLQLHLPHRLEIIHKTGVTYPTNHFK